MAKNAILFLDYNSTKQGYVPALLKAGYNVDFIKDIVEVAYADSPKKYYDYDLMIAHPNPAYIDSLSVECNNLCPNLLHESLSAF